LLSIILGDCVCVALNVFSCALGWGRRRGRQKVLVLLPCAEAAGNVNQELARFSEAGLQVVAGECLVKSKLENGLETVQRRSDFAATLAWDVMRET
jgi:hypothetical protein